MVLGLAKCAKLICNNLTCVILSQCELGIEADDRPHLGGTKAGTSLLCLRVDAVVDGLSEAKAELVGR